MRTSASRKRHRWLSRADASKQPRRGCAVAAAAARCPASSAAGTSLRQPVSEPPPRPRQPVTAAPCRPRERRGRARRSRCNGRARARATSSRTMRSRGPSRPSTEAAVSWTNAPARTTSSRSSRILLDVRVPLGMREHGHDPLADAAARRSAGGREARSSRASRAAAAAGCRRARTASARQRSRVGSRSSAISPPPRTSIAIPASATARARGASAPSISSGVVG